jgi:Putative DNA-binding domain
VSHDGEILMHVPVRLDEWTYDTIVDLASVGRCEGERHDFKLNLPDARNLTKICCAFSNSLGGFVVVGIRDRSGHYLVEGVEPDSEIAKKFADKLHAVPSIEFSSPLVVDMPDSAKVLYVFHVPQSGHRPHVPRAPDQSLFWKRTPGGCEIMSYDEIQEQFLRYEERRDKLKLLFIELLLNRENLQRFLSVEANEYSLVTLDSGVLDRLLVDTYSVVQEDHRLIQILLTLRTQIRVSNAKAQIFFSQMAQPLTNQTDLVAIHNQFMKEKADFLLPLISEALDILEKRFGIKDPFPD